MRALDLGCHGTERLLYFCRVFCGSLEEVDAQGLRVCLGVVRLELLLQGEVTLVADQHLVHLFVGVPVDLAADFIPALMVERQRILDLSKLYATQSPEPYPRDP